MSPRAEVRWAATLPKLGHPHDGDEDRYLVAQAGRVAAISDGASHSFHARRWAGCLVERYCAEPTSALGPEWMGPAIRAFHAGLDLDGLPWHALAQLGRGTFATLLGVRLLPEPALELVAVGDSCAFVLPPTGGVDSFPASTAEELAADPILLCTLADRNEAGLAAARARRVPLGGGTTTVVLTTDAVARTLLDARDRVGPLAVRATILAWTSRRHFDRWVHAERHAGRMRDDDSTALMLTFHQDDDDAVADRH